jgi:hypothetical protein
MLCHPNCDGRLLISPSSSSQAASTILGRSFDPDCRRRCLAIDRAEIAALRR